MSSSLDLPQGYLDLNNFQTKNVSIVVEIEGLALLTNRVVFRTVRYGDVGIMYGDPGLIYGANTPVPGQKDLLSLEGSSLTLSQRLEPEQGRGAVSQLSLAFIDKDQYMTKVISPGVLIDDIMGKAANIWLGFVDENGNGGSFKEDYFVIMRGKVTGVQSQVGRVILQFSDPNFNRRQNIFFTAKTKLNGSITNSSTTINVISNGDFNKKILGPSGSYDTNVKTYVKIEDEIIEYQQAGSEGTGFGTNQFVGVLRGQRGTTAAAHADQVDVEAAIEIKGHAIDLALKLMLSGFNSTWLSDVPILNFVKTQDLSLGDISNAIILPIRIDAQRDYGLVAGDFISITGATNGGNNITTTVVGFEDLSGETNRIILCSNTFTAELNSPAKLAFRSQYDTFPINCGAKLTPQDVDVQGHLDLKSEFLGSSTFSYRFFITEQTACKTFLESEIYLPFAMYSLTKRGKLSVSLTKPPIADERLQILTIDNILEPVNMRISRALNNRAFFNEIDWEFDFSDAGDASSIVKSIDSDSIGLIGQAQVLPIVAHGARTDLSFDQVLESRTTFLLNRYKKGATILELKVNWQVGSQLEAGDVVAVKDNGTLQLANFETGVRDLGVQLFEIVDRSFDLKNGNVSLKLISGTGAKSIDKFATISPSSKTDTGSTTTKIIIKDSFGPKFPMAEFKKWEDYVGLPIVIHNYSFSQVGIATFTGFDPSNRYALLITPALSFTPPADYIVDIDFYPTSSDPTVNALYKVVHAYIDPSVNVVSGISNTKFTVSGGDALKFHVGLPVYIHNTDYSILSNEVLVSDVTGTTITVDSDLGFTPSASQTAELIGFADSGAPYRLI